jgi:hypothetical protein
MEPSVSAAARFGAGGMKRPSVAGKLPAPMREDAKSRAREGNWNGGWISRVVSSFTVRGPACGAAISRTLKTIYRAHYYSAFVRAPIGDARIQKKMSGLQRGHNLAHMLEILLGSYI